MNHGVYTVSGTLSQFQADPDMKLFAATLRSSLLGAFRSTPTIPLLLMKGTLSFSPCIYSGGRRF